MRIEYIDGFSVTGLSVRTKNALELMPKTANISLLWEAFSTHCRSFLSEDAKIYGVYTQYETDASGEFNVLACSDQLTCAQFDDVKCQCSYPCESMTIEAGKYLVFSAKGKMPQTVIQLWDEVWRYFNAFDCEHVRIFNTDFEYYKHENEVEIAIGVE